MWQILWLGVNDLAWRTTLRKGNSIIQKITEDRFMQRFRAFPITLHTI